MNHESHWADLAEIHALGALDGEDLLLWKEHFGQGCPDCQTRIDETQNLLSGVPLMAPLAPPASVKTALMNRVGGVAAPAAAGAGAGIAVAALIGVGVLALGSWFVFSKPSAPVSPAPATVSAPAPATAVEPAPKPKTETPAAPAGPVHDAEIEAMLKDPDTRLIEFKDPESGQKLKAQFHWNPKSCNGCLVVQGLSKTDLDKVYEFWAIAAGGPVAAGTFTVDAEGNGHIDVKGLDLTKEYKQFAVTIEPRGGVAAPTGPMKLLSL